MQQRKRKRQTRSVGQLIPKERARHTERREASRFGLHSDFTGLAFEPVRRLKHGANRPDQAPFREATITLVEISRLSAQHNLDGQLTASPILLAVWKIKSGITPVGA